MAESSRQGVILIAERDENVRQLQRFFLERAGCAVSFCDDGVAALDAARSSHPILVVTEILIPKIDGLTLCRELRADDGTRHIPVVVFSILAAAARAAHAGASAYLRKPFVEAAFLATIRGALGALSSPAQMEHQWASM
jgi:CheY-like chemotaxis protein